MPTNAVAPIILVSNVDLMGHRGEPRSYSERTQGVNNSRLPARPAHGPQLLIKAVTGEVGSGTQVTGYPTTRPSEFCWGEMRHWRLCGGALGNMLDFGGRGCEAA